MFTGIIEELGRVAAIQSDDENARIVISAKKVVDGTNPGDSIAVNGVCLTALNIKPDSFEADVSGETLSRSTLGNLQVGTPVNLERALTPSTRIGGHIVQGHVDGRGKFVSASQSGDFWTVNISFPDELSPYFVFKGSVAIEGISLTIAMLGEDFMEFAVIPKTWEMTNLSSLRPGDAVNIEVDVIAKYVERLITPRNPAA